MLVQISLDGLGVRKHNMLGGDKMGEEETLKLLTDNEYGKAAYKILKEYIGLNSRQFERDDLERRARILEMQIIEKKNSLLREHQEGEMDDKSLVGAIFEYAREALKVIVPDEELAVEEIESEDEDLEEGVPIYKIGSYPSDPTLEGLYLKKQREEIIIPRFQRGWVWTPTQASKLIDSFLLGLPVPSIFVYKEASGKQIVIDGQQRLRTIWGFFDGVLPDGSPFYLRGVSPQWAGLYYKGLNEVDKIRFRDSILRTVIVEQINPQDTTSIYHIFERLNTGGTGLTAQEVRNCSYHGPFNDMLFELNEYKSWRAVFGVEKLDARMRDLELIVRFLALNEGSYVKPMKGFLNIFMGKHQGGKDIEKYKRIFVDTIDKVFENLGARPFHIKRGINAAVFDSVTVAFAKDFKIPKDIKDRYLRLLANENYRDTITAHTTDADAVKQRLELAQEVLFR